MIARLQWAPSLVREIRNGNWYSPPLGEPRVGVMLHYDGSGSDRGGVEWFADPRCRVSYNWLVLDDGSYVEIAPPECAAWHAGRCTPSDPRLSYRSANRGLYGISAATNDRTDVTPLQLLTIAWLTRRCFEREGWPVTDGWRIVGHSSEAVNRDGTRGRKIDPEGPDQKNPIYSPEDVRMLLGRIVL